MFDRIFDFIEAVWEWFIPFEVVDQDYKAVVLRLGKFHRVIGPGFNWILPFGIEDIRGDCVVPRIRNLEEQSLVTADGKQIILGVVVTAELINIKRALLGIENVDGAIEDSCLGVIGEYVRLNNWKDICDAEFPQVLREECHAKAVKFGVKISNFQLTNLTPARTFRVIQ